MQPLPLRGIRVLECGDTQASAYAGRLLADLGADVVLVEAPAGHPLRLVGPFVAAGDAGERSAGFGYFAAGKRSVVIDPAASGGAKLLEELITRADAVLRSGAIVTDDVIARAVAADRSLIVADITTFGRVGDVAEAPPAVNGHSVSDLLALAASGLLSLNSTRAGSSDATPDLPGTHRDRRWWRQPRRRVSAGTPGRCSPDGSVSTMAKSTISNPAAPCAR